MRRCLDPDPARRPPARLLLLRHPFLLAPIHAARADTLLPALLPFSVGIAGPSEPPVPEAESGGSCEIRSPAVMFLGWNPLWSGAGRRGWAWAVGLEGGFADGAAEAEFVKEWHGGAAGRARGAAISCMPVWLWVGEGGGVLGQKH